MSQIISNKAVSGLKTGSNRYSKVQKRPQGCVLGTFDGHGTAFGKDAPVIEIDCPTDSGRPRLIDFEWHLHSVLVTVRNERHIRITSEFCS